MVVVDERYGLSLADHTMIAPHVGRHSPIAIAWHAGAVADSRICRAGGTLPRNAHLGSVGMPQLSEPCWVQVCDQTRSLTLGALIGAPTVREGLRLT
jgi:hypothetical protein